MYIFSYVLVPHKEVIGQAQRRGDGLLETCKTAFWPLTQFLIDIELL